MKSYPYIGDSEILEKLPSESQRACILNHEDLLAWITQTKQTLSSGKTLIVTFIIDQKLNLWINDRHSEHVLCANGEAVLSAGEMTFLIHDKTIEIIDISNQSTGYCPEPDSWEAVEKALRRTTIRHELTGFTHEFIFRQCEYCQTINIIKDGWFECTVCDSPLKSA